MEPFSVRDEGDTLVLVLRGELDFTNATQITKGIRESVAGRRAAQVSVDLTEVTFLDSSGIGVLVSAMRAADGAGAGFRVTNPGPNVLDQLRTTGLAEAFRLDDPDPA